jgi:hypothetical protein
MSPRVVLDVHDAELDIGIRELGDFSILIHLGMKPIRPRALPPYASTQTILGRWRENRGDSWMRPGLKDIRIFASNSLDGEHQSRTRNHSVDSK